MLARGRFLNSLRLTASCSRTSTSSSKASPAVVVDTAKKTTEVFDQIAENLSDPRQKLFAVVYVNGRQWKVTDGDLISLEGNLPLAIGDEINLEKVLMVGGANFSIFGRPLLAEKAAKVEAVVVEKSTKCPEIDYTHYNHNQTKIVNWRSEETTVLRIRRVSANQEFA
ncbi:unnamed protein product [Caenorhabditis auriculariae]|uniref:Large ribosomal subunit protein bL21m n=1 Tax=Caenorhabditis auriculariae TaxID=2777116 RepID=A0A8S1GZH7_9PELO|nr:unnamed protein product [Caenorhabditis auriculariae]